MFGWCWKVLRRGLVPAGRVWLPMLNRRPTPRYFRRPGYSQRRIPSRPWRVEKISGLILIRQAGLVPHPMDCICGLLIQVKAKSFRPEAFRLSIHLSFQRIDFLLGLGHLVLQPRNIRVTGCLVFHRDFGSHQSC